MKESEPGKRWTFEENIGAVLLLALTLVVTLQIVGRLIGTAPIWTEEIARFLFLWSIFLGVSAGVTRDSHVGTEILAAMLPPKGKHVLKILANFLFIVFGVLVVVKSIGLLAMQVTMGQRAPATNIPLYVVGISVPIGFTLTVIRLFLKTWKLMRNPAANQGADAPIVR